MAYFDTKHPTHLAEPVTDADHVRGPVRVSISRGLVGADRGELHSVDDILARLRRI